MADGRSILEYEPRRVRRPWRLPYSKLMTLLLVLSAIVLVLIPTMKRPPGHSWRTTCLSQMREIGLLLHQYAVEHKGQFMDQLDPTWIRSAVCPGTHQGTPVAYVYFGKGLTRETVTPRHVLLYEPLGNHTTGNNAGINILLGDGSVRSIPTAQAQKIIAELQAGLNPPPSLK